jgi:hypothetical protein
MPNKKQAVRYGIFYRSNGRWTTSPYGGFTFTRYTMNRRPLRQDLATLRNYVLKSKMMVLPVGSR